MRIPKTPPQGYHAFKHKETGEPSLMLFLGAWDSIDNYEAITEEEYHAILKAKEDEAI